MAETDLIVLDNLHFEVVKGLPTIVRLEYVLDFKRSEVRLEIWDKWRILNIVPQNGRSATKMMKFGVRILLLHGRYRMAIPNALDTWEIY